MSASELDLMRRAQAEAGASAEEERARLAGTFAELTNDLNRPLVADAGQNSADPAALDGEGNGTWFQVRAFLFLCPSESLRAC